MPKLFATHSGILTRLFTVTAAAGLLVGVGCSDDDNDSGGTGGPPTTSSFAGAFVGSGDGGRISITISTVTLAPGLPIAKAGAGGSRILGAGSLATTNVTASGSIDLSGGSVIALTGIYNDVTDSLNLTGGGYTFVGAYDSTGSVDAVLGAYSGPNGDGLFGSLSGTSSTVTTFCGTYVNAGVTIQGRWNMIIYGDELFAGAAPNGGSEVIGMEGVITGTGNPRTITLAGDAGGGAITATGTWNTTTNVVTGTWQTSDGISTLDSGTWQGTPCE